MYNNYNFSQEAYVIKDMMGFLTNEQKNSLFSIFLRRKLLENSNYEGDTHIKNLIGKSITPLQYRYTICNIVKNIDLSIYKIFETQYRERAANIFILIEEISVELYTNDILSITVETINNIINEFINKYLC